MLFEKDRKRRVIYNDDADQQFNSRLAYPYDITDERSFIDARTTPTFDTHVDTYVWCVGNGAAPMWGLWGERRGHTVLPFLGSPDRATELIVEACHHRRMEVWGSLRINDLHDAGADRLEDTNDPLKAEHPEYLLGKPEDRELGMELAESHLWTAFNFERPEVRRHRLDFIERNAAAHDFDGYELDFTRFIWNLPQGRERELAPVMTDFIREVRSRLNAIGDTRGRPCTFAVHVMDSVETSLQLGLDVGAWVSESLVDVLIVGMGYQPYTLRLDQWTALGDRYGVPIYPSLNTTNLARLYKERLRRVSDWHAFLRAAAAWWWHNDADGIYLFNFFTHKDSDVGGIDSETVFAPLKDIGDPAALVGEDKLYGIQPLKSAGTLTQGAESAPLPIPLDVGERRLPLQMGPDADDPRARFTIHAWTSGGSADTKVWMRLNHTLLEPVRQDDHYSVDAPAGIMRVGRNELTICCDAELGETTNPTIVHEVLTSVAY